MLRFLQQVQRCAPPNFDRCIGGLTSKNRSMKIVQMNELRIQSSFTDVLLVFKRPIKIATYQ